MSNDSITDTVYFSPLKYAFKQKYVKYVRIL